MRINFRTILLGLVYALLALFAFENRGRIFSYPKFEGVPTADVSDALGARLFFQDLGMPVGSALLVFIGLLSLLYLFYSVSLRTSTLVEVRKYTKEVEVARRLADEAEASRIGQLQGTIEALVGSLREESESRYNMLAATLGEIEDRMERGGGEGPAEG
jgi:hypothetical protein